MCCAVLTAGHLHSSEHQQLWFNNSVERRCLQADLFRLPLYVCVCVFTEPFLSECVFDGNVEGSSRSAQWEEADETCVSPTEALCFQTVSLLHTSPVISSVSSLSSASRHLPLPLLSRWLYQIILLVCGSPLLLLIISNLPRHTSCSGPGKNSFTPGTKLSISGSFLGSMKFTATLQTRSAFIKEDWKWK